MNKLKKWVKYIYEWIKSKFTTRYRVAYLSTVFMVMQTIELLSTKTTSSERKTFKVQR